MKKNETHLRSIYKAISWRMFATMLTIVISYIVTHHIKYALSIGSIEIFAKILLYYIHERFWLFFSRDMSYYKLASHND